MSLLKKTRRIARRCINIPSRAWRDIKESIREKRVRKTWLTDAEIKKYRTGIKIYDVFPFFNELDILELRLNILDPYVDYFVISEATQTYSGKPKPLYFQENKKRFEKWAHKIIYQVIDDVPSSEQVMQERLNHPELLSPVQKDVLERTLGSEMVNIGVAYWFQEFYIKESMKKALVGLRDTDICYVSDVDEIWNPHLVIDYTKSDLFKPRQKVYMYYLNNRSNEDWTGWTGSLVTTYKNIRNGCLNNLLRNDNPTHIGLKDGGWHFTFQGGLEGAMRKITESDHPFYQPDDTIPFLQRAVMENIDYKGRDIKLYVDESGLPEYLIQNKGHYQKFFK